MSDWAFNGVARMTEMLSAEALTAFLQVVMIDLVLAGDNAVVIGLAAAGLHESQRNKAILVGIFAATILRIGFASITVQLLEIIGLLLAGGILLLWVCWKMWRELRTSPAHHQNAKAALNDQDINADGMISGPSRKTLGQAIWQITIADVSMSLDNVLAVVGAGRGQPPNLAFGLGLFTSPLGLAPTLISRPPPKDRPDAHICPP